MPTLTERLKAQQRAAADKQSKIDKNNRSIKDLQETNKVLNKELAVINDTIQGLTARILADAAGKHGIDVAVITAAIEAGKFDNTAADEKPPDNSNNLNDIQETDKNSALGGEDICSTEDSETMNNKEDTKNEAGNS